MSETDVASGAVEAGHPASGAGGCPVDHEAVLADRAAQASGCPVDHRAPAAGGARPASTCAWAPGAAKRGYLLPGLIAFLCLLVIGAVLDITDFSHSSGDQLGGPLVAGQIASALQTRSGGAAPTVTCPPTEPVAAGRTFTCRVDAGGGARTALVTETGGGQFHFALQGAPAG